MKHLEFNLTQFVHRESDNSHLSCRIFLKVNLYPFFLDTWTEAKVAKKSKKKARKDN